jgi:hypothetical protein
MAKRKFEALADFRQNPLDNDAEGTEAIQLTTVREAAAVIPAVAQAARGKGRPPGKRSNPQWKLYSHFLKKQTQREAAALLAAREDARDLSDILQELLEHWLAEQHS